MPSAPQSISQRKLLMGEGQDERRFFSAMFKHMNRQDIQVEDYGGKNALRSRLKALPQRSGFSQLESLCIVRDADDNAASAWQSVHDALRDAGLPVPDLPKQMAGAHPRVGVLILPGGQAPGALEDLCLQALQDDVALACVDNYFHCLSEQNQRQPKNLAKARVHAWLASREDPLRLGEAAERGYWPWNHCVFTALKAFLQTL